MDVVKSGQGVQHCWVHSSPPGIRTVCPELVRLLLDWGADPQVESVDRSVESTRSNSVMSRISSVVTRSKINKVWRKGLNQSVMSGEKRQKM